MVRSRAQLGELGRTGAVALFLIATAVIILAAVGAFRHYANDLSTEVANDLMAMTRLKKSLIQDQLEERYGDAAVLAAHPSVRRLLDHTATSASNTELDSDLHSVLDAHGDARVLVLDPSQRTLAAVVAQDSPDPNGALHPGTSLSTVFREGKPMLVDLFSAVGNLRYAVAYPVTSLRNKAEVTGAVLLEVDVRRKILPVLMNWFRESRTGESYIVRFADGKLLQIGGNPALLPEQIDEHPAPTDPRRIGTRLLQGQTGVMTGLLDRREQPVLAAAERIDGAPWFMVSKVDVAEVEASLDDLRAIIAGLALTFILLVGSLTWMIWRIARERQTLVNLQYSHALDTAIDGFMRYDTEGRLLEANQALADLTGYSRSKLETLHIPDLEAAYTATEVERMLDDLKASGTARRFITRWRVSDDRILDIDINTVYVPATDCFYGYVRDISETVATGKRLQQLNHYYNFLIHLDEALAGLREPIDILAKVCITAVEYGHFQIAWAGLPEAEGDGIHIVCLKGASEALADELKLSTRADAPGGDGPIGRSWREQRVVVLNDLLTDDRIAVRHGLAKKYSVRAASGIPIVVGGKTVAAISFNSSEVGFFTDELIQLLQETGRQVALAWEASQAAHERDAESALRHEAEVRYQRIFDSSPVAKQLHAISDARLLAINLTHERTFGYAIEELTHEDGWFRLAYPDPALRERIRTAWLADMQRARDLGIVTHSPEVSLRAKDGSLRVVRGAMAVTGDVAIVTWTDLTEIRAQEAALRASEARFLGTFEQAAVGIALFTPQGTFQNVNGKLCEILGYTRDELIGSDFKTITYPDDIPADLGAMADLIDGRTTNHVVEKRYLHKDGRPVWVNLTASLVRKADEAPDYFICVIEDIAARKAAEAALQESERRFRGMVEKTVSGFYVVQDNMIVYANAALCALSGFSQDELIGRSALDFVVPEDQGEVTNALPRLLAGERTLRTQIRVRRKDGNIAIAGILMALGEWDGKPARVAIVEDVTERVRSAEKLADYVKRLEQSMKGTLEAVARMVDMRDPYTAGHQRRVGLIAAAIGKSLGWDEHRCRTMELIGLVHDIGKIAVPAELLSKPTRLTAIEYELIKGHAQASYDILKDVQFDVPVADIIVQHHERIDGTGYPRGLKGDEISIEGRVLAVADVVESMASHRPYRPALGIDAALAELDRGRDTLYDGHLVDVLKQMVAEGYVLPT